jgi:hypothetical protein
VVAVPEKEPTTRIVRQLRSGQVTIPADFGRRLGIVEDTLLQMTLVAGELRIRPVQVRESRVGSPCLNELYERFAPVREEAAGYSEEEIDADVDRAVARVRTQRDQGRL